MERRLSKRLRRGVVLPIALAVLAPLIGVVAATAATCPPSNDAVTGARDIPDPLSLPWVDTVDTCGAGPTTTPAATDTSEPAPHCAFSGWGATVWYRWPARAEGATLTLRTLGSTAGNAELDTVIAVYRVQSGRLVNVACNDDTDQPANSRTSRVRFDALPNAEYVVQVGGVVDPSTRQARTGQLRFEALSHPLNDEMTNAIDLAPGTADQRNTSGASGSSTEPRPSCAGGKPVQSSVWYSFTVRSNSPEPVTFDTFGSNFDTAFAIFDASLNQLACNDNAATGIAQSRHVFRANTVGRYLIQVWGRTATGDNTATGSLVFRAFPTPANDAMADAGAITLPSVTAGAREEGSSAGAMVDGVVPTCHKPGNVFGPTVWYTFSVAQQRTVVINTFGSAYNTILAVYGAGGSQVACNDDAWAGTTASRVSFTAPAGTYTIQLGGTTATAGTVGLQGGAFVLNLPTPNDDWSFAHPVSTIPSSDERETTGTTGSERFLNTNGVILGNETSLACSGTAPSSIWYRLTAPQTRTVTIHTHGSGPDTILSAYAIKPDGSPGAELACNDDAPNAAFGQGSRIQFAATVGTTYLVRVAAKSAGGSIITQFASPPLCDAWDDPNSACAAVGDGTLSVTRPLLSMASATHATDDPPPSACVPAGSTLGSTLWFRYEADRIGLLSVNTLGSDYDSVLTHYRRNGSTWDEQAPCSGTADSAKATRLLVPVAPGQTHYFQVGGVNGAFGVLGFQMSLRPGNDDREAATLIPIPTVMGTTFFQATQSTVGATTQDGEQTPRNNAGLDRCGANPTQTTPAGATVWYRMTLPVETRTVADTTGSSFRNVIGVWRKTGETFQPVACHAGADNTTSSEVGWTALAGEEYYIQIGGFGTGTSALTGELKLAIRIPAPSNNSVAGAAPITVNDADGTQPRFRDTRATYGATMSGAAPASCLGGATATSDVWYTVVPGTRTKFDLFTSGSDYGVAVAIYEATSTGTPASTPVACASSLTPGAASLHPTLQAGTRYFVQVIGLNGRAGKLNVTAYSSPTL